MASKYTGAFGVDPAKVLQATSMNMAFTLDVLLHWPIRHSILLVGDHGIGKDGIVKTAGLILNCPVIDVRLSQNDVGDIKGMPFRVKGKTLFAPPDWMPFKEESVELDELMDNVATSACKRAGAPRGILFLNELNRAVREVQQCAFEMVLDRTMNTRELRDGWRIVTAINGDDHYQVTLFDLALKSRFFVEKLRPTHEEWVDWAKDPEVKAVVEDPEVFKAVCEPITGPLHPAVVQFIQRYPKLLDPTDELLTKAEADVTMQVHNRRGWHMLSDCLMVRERIAALGAVPQPVSKDKQSLNHLFMMATGYVGTMAATEFMRFVETDYQSLSGDIILNKWDKDVAKKVKDVIDGGRVIEISRYTDMVIDEVKSAKGRVLSPLQKRNVTSYARMLTKEMRAHLWKRFMDDAKEACLDWYEPKEIKDLILDALATPGK